MSARVLALLALLAVSAATASEPRLPAVDLFYDVTWAGIGVGQAEFRLKPDASAPDCYVYDSLTHPTGLAALLYGAPQQHSWFCLRGGRVVPRQMSSSGAGQNYVLRFDWARRVVTGGRDGARELPEGAVDSVSLQQAVRLWAIEQAGRADPQPGRFVMVDDHNIQTDVFRVAGRDKVTVPAGTFDTVVVERIDAPGKTARFWLAPARDWMPVKAVQRNGHGPSVEMRLMRLAR